ncbi:MAG: 1-deoxy-D-xylulose-5-phosphate reductoisomerase [Steroidobacteraceae bacterium]
MIGVAVLGATGSIGDSALDVLARHPERFRVVALGARANASKLAAQCARFRPDHAVLVDPVAARELAERLAAQRIPTRVAAGAEALAEIASSADVDYVVAAIVGAAGLRSTFAAAQAGKRLLIANKESLVMAGPLLLQAAQASGAVLLPIDSEHNAIFQCLPHGSAAGRPPPGVRRVLLTASGGPFLDWPADAIARATPSQACAHPRWSMGRKISVDSATLMNKGLEYIEACLFFGLEPAQVEVLIHRQSIVHSLVEYRDGSVLAQLGSPDMRTPIAQALGWPERLDSGVQFLDLARVGTLDFEAVDLGRFQCLALAQAAARAGGLAPAVLNAANEVAVEAFLQGALNFSDITSVIDAVMQKTATGRVCALDDVLAADAEARARAREFTLARAGRERSAIG